MKVKLILSIFVSLYLPSFLFPETYAIEDPRLVPNNKFGVHILFPTEIHEAAKLVNSNGGDWGYVTIPIQAGDKDLVKWQKFMDDAKTLHVTPIIRIATENYYFDSRVWRKPDFSDILDFANFLDSLNWPTLNRYVIIFNEPNRADEWGGAVNPVEYANILSYAVEEFKSKSEDFFIISAGFDNAAPNMGDKYKDQYDFMRQMDFAVPRIFSQIDAIASHSYPNPGFKQPPNVLTRRSIGSFIYEKKLADSLGDKDLSVFITETGWSKNEVLDEKIASYYHEAFESVWSDENVVAVTPFLLMGGNGMFSQFSLTSENGNYYEDYNALKKIAKIKGEPKLIEDKKDSYILKDTILPTKDFSGHTLSDNDFDTKSKVDAASRVAKWFLRL